MTFPIVFQGRITLVLRLFGQLFSTSHVAAKLIAVFLLNEMHFTDGLLQIVRCSHCLVMQFVGKSDIGDEKSTHKYRKFFNSNHVQVFSNKGIFLAWKRLIYTFGGRHVARNV
ncbi:hypothetical protein QF001_001754 [Paraburkholderia youngii]